MPSKKHLRNTANYKSLPYNPKLKEYAQNLRKAGNLAEVLFWNEVDRIFSQLKLIVEGFDEKTLLIRNRLVVRCFQIFRIVDLVEL